VLPSAPPARDRAAHADAGADSNCFRRLSSASPRRRARRVTMACGQRVLAALVEAGCEAQHLVGVEAPRHRASKLGAPFGQRAGLVDDQGVDLAQVLDRRRVAEQHALGGARPVATMIDIGVARPSAQGQAMISTATALIRP
jgi:hypothetical protein